MTKFYNISTDNTLGGDNPSDVEVSSQKAVKEYIANISITYTLNTNVNVAGNTKDVAHVYPEAVFARGGLIMGGTAQAAGLVTRGICGSSTPNATTGACSKDRLYINYDGDNVWNPSGRGVVINAGSYGTDLGQGMYSYCAVRGDIVKAWVEAQGYALSSAIPTVNDGTLTISKNGTSVGTFTANQSTASNVNINIDGVLNSRDDTTVIKTWVGTQAQYDAIATKDDNTVYVTTSNILDEIYPIGSIYLTTASTCPLATLIAGSTWELVSQDRVLQGSSTNHTAGSTIAAGLPNITGGVNIGYGSAGGAVPSLGAAFYNSTTVCNMHSGSGSNNSKAVAFSASRSSSIYGNSTTVQPPAYVVNVFRRVA